jgi:FkbM family methyltransferase
MTGPGGIDFSALVGDPKDIAFARKNLPALEYAANLARERGQCVQAGANVGIFPLFLAQCFATVHTFEPSISALDDYFENVPSHDQSRIVLHAAALGRAPGKAWLHTRRRNGEAGHSGTYHVTLADEKLPGETVGGHLVELATIDALGLTACGLIYLDIEGFELYALIGARATIHRCRPVIGVEINKNLDQLGIRPSAVIDWIAEQGYRPAASFGSDWIFAPAEWGE